MDPEAPVDDRGKPWPSGEALVGPGERKTISICRKRCSSGKAVATGGQHREVKQGIICVGEWGVGATAPYFLVALHILMLCVVFFPPVLFFRPWDGAQMITSILMANVSQK